MMWENNINHDLREIDCTGDDWKTLAECFGTYLCLLFHTVAFDIKALVIPWHQFVYTPFIPYGRLDIQPASFRSSLFAKRLPTSCFFIFENKKKSQGARSGLYGGARKMSQWNCSHSKVCGSAGKYADVHCRATEEFHARICLFGKIT